MKILTGKKILIVDASTFVCEAIKSDLETQGALIATETGSDAALMKIIRWHPDLIISAVEIGRINGFDLCLILKLMPEYAGIPVIIMSSNEKDIATRKAADAGADHYVPKNAEMFVALRLTARQILEPAAKSGHAERKKRDIRSALVVDDSRVMRKVITNILHGIGVEKITEAENGIAALTELKKFSPDLVITDWNMPEMTGIELIQAMRKCPEYNSIPIAMVTTETGQQEVAEAKAAGADAHLCKPFSAQAMKKMIASLQDGDHLSA